jgi:hypothetical protein
MPSAQSIQMEIRNGDQSKRRKHLGLIFKKVKTTNRWAWRYQSQVEINRDQDQYSVDVRSQQVTNNWQVNLVIPLILVKYLY